MRPALRTLGRETGFLLLGYSAIAIPMRLVWLSLAEGAPAASFFAIWWGDIAAALIVAAAWVLLVGFLPWRAFRIWSGGVLLVLCGLALIASARYYLNYETPFRPSHLSHVEGAAQMTESIAAELNAPVILGAIAVVLFVALWGAAGLRGWGFGLVAPTHNRVARASAVLVGEGLLAIAVGFGHNLGRTSGTAERGFNLLHQLAMVGEGGAPRPRSELGAASRNGDRPRSVRFSADSLVSTTLHPRFPFPAQGKRFNIVIYLFEGTAVEYIGQHQDGRALTPNWTRLAENSLRMLNHHASNPLTINALFSLLTSAFPLPADRWAIKDFPALPVQSLPEKLHAAGYRTGIVNTGYFKYARQENFLRRRGFDLIMDVNQLRRPPYTRTLNWGIDDRALIGPAVAFAKSDPNRPFFLLMKPETPHHPYDVPEDRFLLQKPEQVSGSRARSLAKYKNALFFADHVMGEAIESFEQAGLGEDTLFFVLADHGEAFGQHRGNYNHPFYIYQENIHVPFLIYNKRLFPRTRSLDRITRHEDVPVTILDLLGLPGDQDHQGRSFLRAGREQIAFFNTTWRNDLAGLRDGRWKYIFNRKTEAAELYDLLADPREQNNLAQESPQLVRRYHEKLMAFRAHQRAWYERVLGRRIDWTLTMSKDGL